MHTYRIYAVFYDILARCKWFFINGKLSDLFILIINQLDAQKFVLQ